MQRQPYLSTIDMQSVWYPRPDSNFCLGLMPPHIMQKELAHVFCSRNESHYQASRVSCTSLDRLKQDFSDFMTAETWLKAHKIICSIYQ